MDGGGSARGSFRRVGVALVLLAAAAVVWRLRGEAPDGSAHRGSPPSGPQVPVPPPAGPPEPPRPVVPPPPGPQDPPSVLRSPRELAELSLKALEAYLDGEAPPEGLKDPESWATGLPLGYAWLVIRAHPDEAFAVLSTRYTADPVGSPMAYAGLRELARLRHEPTFRFFNALLDNPDAGKVEQAVLALSDIDGATPADRVLARLPNKIEDADDSALTRAVLVSLASMKSTDARRLEAALERVRALEKESGSDHGTTEAARRLSMTRGASPAEALSARLQGEAGKDLQGTRWAAEEALRRGLKDAVPALRARADAEIGRLRRLGREGELDLADLRRKGRIDLPSADAPVSLVEVRLIASLRKAVVDLGGTPTDEERRWLDELRLLRPPAEYLREAGIRTP